MRNIYIGFRFHGLDLVLYIPALSGKPGNNHLDLKTMFTQGAWLAVLLWVLLVGAGYVLVRFWPAFGVA